MNLGQKYWEQVACPKYLVNFGNFWSNRRTPLTIFERGDEGMLTLRAEF
jgi:hypothetical protein